jgi:hypothetical protein
MRKSGFAAAAGLGSLALLLTACGGSSGGLATTGNGQGGVWHVVKLSASNIRA